MHCRNICIITLKVRALFFKNQHGFRQRLSTVTLLSECVHDFVKGINEGGQIDAIVLDMPKDFDRVPHKTLLCKLDNFGMNWDVIQWIRGYLKDQTQFVDVN